MINITYENFHKFVCGFCDHKSLKRQLKQLLELELRTIVVENDMMSLDGEDVVDIANQVVQAVKDGFEIVTWHDDDNTFVVGVRPGAVNLS